MLNGESEFENRSQENLKYRSLLLIGPRGSTQRARGTTEETQGKVQTEKVIGSTGHAFIRIHVWSALGQFIPKEQHFGKLHA